MTTSASATDVILRDGSTLQLRPIEPADTARLRRFHEQLSRDTTRLRFFSFHPRLTDEEVAHFVNVDGSDRVAVVAIWGDDIVAVGRYDRTSQDTAEVAFTVADRMQGHGVGSLLLEHLAAIARGNGITRLRADTLSDNTRMLGVFRESGFATVLKRDRDVVTVSLDIADSLPYSDAVERREWIAAAASMRRLLEPRSVAVIGAGRDEQSIGRRLLENIQRGGYAGRLYAVNPNATTIGGIVCYPDVAAMPAECDLGIIAVPASQVPAVVEKCGRAGMHGLVIISSGFAETGPAGAEAERAVAETAHRHGMRLIGPNCMGVINSAIGLDATFAATAAPRGYVGFASQSGAMGIALLERASAEGIGLTTFVSLGNKADVSGNDMLRYWYDDASTRVALLYLESLGNPRAFARIARIVSRRKPIVALKAGRSTAGARAARSHTAALASSETAVNALFAHTGVIRVATLEDLLDTASLLSSQDPPRGPRVAVVTNAGGAGILCADACVDAGLDVPELSTQLQLDLSAGAPASAANPVDLGAGARPGDFAKALERCLDSTEVDAGVVIVAPVSGLGPAELFSVLARMATSTRKPVVPVILGGEPPREEDRYGLPAFRFPENAAAALGRAYAYACWRSRPERAVVDVGADVAAVETAVNRVLRERPRGRWLDPAAVEALLDAYGITRAAESMETSAAGAVIAARRIGFPVALKAVGEEIVHKTEAGGVVLGIRSAARLIRAWHDLRTRLGSSMSAGLVQAMVKGDAELIIGGINDPAFGPLVMVGSGGVTAELGGDQVFATAPLAPDDAAELLDRTRAGRLLSGFRGHPPLARAQVLSMLQRVAQLLAAHPQIAELDLNPVVVNEAAATVVDARIRVIPAAVPGLPVRQLARGS